MTRWQKVWRFIIVFNFWVSVVWALGEARERDWQDLAIWSLIAISWGIGYWLNRRNVRRELEWEDRKEKILAMMKDTTPRLELDDDESKEETK